MAMGSRNPAAGLGDGDLMGRYLSRYSEERGGGVLISGLTTSCRWFRLINGLVSIGVASGLGLCGRRKGSFRLLRAYEGPFWYSEVPSLPSSTENSGGVRYADASVSDLSCACLNPIRDEGRFSGSWLTQDMGCCRVVRNSSGGHVGSVISSNGDEANDLEDVRGDSGGGVDTGACDLDGHTVTADMPDEVRDRWLFISACPGSADVDVRVELCPSSGLCVWRYSGRYYIHRGIGFVGLGLNAGSSKGFDMET